MQEKPLEVILISKRKAVIFYSTFLEYKDKIWNYEDTYGISYSLSRTNWSVNFFRTNVSSKYKVKFRGIGKVFAITTSRHSLFHDEAPHKDIEEDFIRLIGAIERHVTKFILGNLLMRFNNEDQLKIGLLVITPQGLFRKRLFRKDKYLPWQQYYGSNLSNGEVYLYEKNEVVMYKKFYKCPVGITNAVMLPDLLGLIMFQQGAQNK